MSRISRATLVAPLLSLLILAAAPAGAEAPDGTYVFDIGGANQLAIFDGGVDLGAILPFQYLCDELDTQAKGKLVGECEFDIPIPGNNGTGKVSGRVKREDGRVSVTQKVRAKGTIRAQGQRFRYDILYAVKLIAEDGNPSLTYRYKTKSCVEGRCGKARDSLVLPTATSFPAALQNEDWTLTLDVATKRGKKVRGTAVVETASGRQIEYDVKGKYKRRKDRASLELEPAKRSGKGTSIELDKVTVAGGVMAGKLEYSLFGTRGTLDATSQ